MNKEMLDKMFQESEVILDESTELVLKGHELLQQIVIEGKPREMKVARVEAELYIAWLQTRAPQIEAERRLAVNDRSKSSFEAQLSKLLKYICRELRMQIDEWDMDEDFAGIIKDSPKTKLLRVSVLCQTYDSVIRTAELLGVEVDSKFLLFRGLTG